MADEGTPPTVTWLERDHWSTPTPRPKDHPPGALAPRFERRGSELVLVVPIGHDEARNGALIIVPTPGAPVRLRVPPGTESGRQFRVPRTNAPAPDGFGDLIIVVEVTRPIDIRDLDATPAQPEPAASEPAPAPQASPAKDAWARMDRPPLR